MKYAFTPLTRDETQRLNFRIAKWLSYLEGERSRLKSLSVAGLKDTMHDAAEGPCAYSAKPAEH